MFSADDLINKIREIETLIRNKTNPDGSLRFDAVRVMAGLELAKRMALAENEE